MTQNDADSADRQAGEKESGARIDEQATNTASPRTQDYSIPEDNDPANQDDQANAREVHIARAHEQDLPRSGDVTGGRNHTGTPELAGAGVVYDDGIEPSLRTEMLDNASAYMADTPPANVNDEPGFDDGVPNSFSDFSVVTPENPQGTARLADPNHDAGGEVHGGPRAGGSGGFDGGPQRDHPLPGEEK